MAVSSSAHAKEQGNAAFKAGNFDNAERLYTFAIGACSALDAKHLLHGNRAAARLVLGDAAGALVDADAALQLEPGWDKGWFRRAAALDALGRSREALEAAQKSVTCAGRGDAKPAAELVRRLRRQLSGPASSDTSAAALSSGGPAAQCAAPASDAARAAVTQASHGSGGIKAISRSGRRRLGAADVATRLPPGLRSGHIFQHSADGSDENLLILMHGLGDTPAPFAKLARQLALPQTASLSLPGPLPIPGLPSGRMWFDAFDARGDLLPRRPDGKAAERRAGSLAATLEQLEAALQGVQRNGGWPACSLHLLGFSQGGTAALHLTSTCRGGSALGSCVAVSASFLPGTAAAPTPDNPTSPPLPAPLPDPRSPAASERATPVLITHGDADDMVAREDVDATVKLLNVHNDKPARLETFSKGHQMISGPAEARACMAFWAQHLGAAPPPGGLGEEIVEVAR